ncbi:DUF397 domain-containing protein [Streptomyces sp. 7-21]|uniref:DUF397 domain-containing protein n=1 Tax=Streptomyces sp. 7-21 TaxID=2802283 RepID=UPI00191DB82B|nr:DUF397 domain-containing protein [Streptomyces sp. 7-21]MBL1068245.1 DUF397 domain-containing protein [Streptomyces sp. 7-21]
MTSPRGTDLLGMAWRKSSYSGAQNECVETARLGKAAAVRDSKRPDGPVLVVPAAAWQACLDFLKR